MKHFTLVLAALMTATAATAAPTVRKAHNVSNPHKISMVQKDLSNRTELNHKQIDLNNVSPIVPEAVSRAQSLPIYEPEGDAQMYSVDILGYLQSWGELYFEPSSGMKKVVWGEDGDVYIQNFVNIGVGTYVKGSYADGEIKVTFPQPVFYYEDEEEGMSQLLYLNVLVFDKKAEYLYKNDSNLSHTVTIKVAEDGSMSWNLNPDYTYENYETDQELPEYIVGLTEDTTSGVSDWFGYGDCAQDYTVFELEAITPPATATFDQWVLKYTNDNGSTISQFVEIAFDGNDIYLGNLDEDVPGWVKGTVADGKAFFENGQYMGYSDLYSINLYFLTGTFEEVYLEDYDFWDLHVEFTDGITFEYDKEDKSLTVEESDPAQCFVLNADPEELYFLNICISPEIFWQDPALCNANPENPECIGFQPWDPDFYGGQGGIFWFIPCTNVNGAILDTSRMYYHFLVDGEVYPIDPEEYPFVEEYMEDIPYDYTDGMDIWAMGEEHDIYFYFDGADSFGLQSFYVGDDDVVYASDIVTYIPETEGIDGVKAVQVVDTKYTDLMGRQISNPTNGLYIKTMKLADGSTRSVKVMVK